MLLKFSKSFICISSHNRYNLSLVMKLNDKINGFYLDKQQQDIVLDDSDRLLVVAGAGSGKTLTILGKINYLIKYKNISPDKILCISFTRDSSSGLKDKIKKEFGISMSVYTFHKLALTLLSRNYTIAENTLLSDIIYKFFQNKILNSELHMKLLLSYFNNKSIFDIKNNYLKFYKNNKQKIYQLSKLIETFIRLFKCNNHYLEDYLKFLTIIKRTLSYKNYQKEKSFLILALNIYLEYENYLQENSEIDFDDMIMEATKEVQKQGVKQDLEYIIIDEYQDTSLIRFNLVNELLNKTSAKLMVVGDDFQSIYRFNGCDISLFLNFKEMFKDAKTLKIETTYRNSQEVIDVAGKFIMKNKYQIKKELVSSKHNIKPIKIVKYKNKNTILLKIINMINQHPSSIMILGRNNNDINHYIDASFKLDNDGYITIENRTLDLRYLTVHKSKGLEADNVIIINVNDSIIGFPSQIKEEKILRLVNNGKEKFLFEEERRLFYVALTRTKNNVYLLTEKNKESIFIKELERDYKENIEIINY